jgi:hypothetical protein
MVFIFIPEIQPSPEESGIESVFPAGKGRKEGDKEGSNREEEQQLTRNANTPFPCPNSFLSRVLLLFISQEGNVVLLSHTTLHRKRAHDFPKENSKDGATM